MGPVVKAIRLYVNNESQLTKALKVAGGEGIQPLMDGTLRQFLETLAANNICLVEVRALSDENPHP